VGTFNGTGLKYDRHYDIWTINALQEIILATQHLVPDSISAPNWVNGNLYQQSKEQFGIVPIPHQICTSSGLAAFDPGLDAQREHAFLAKRQGTRLAVLPLHTRAEYMLFTEFMKDPTLFSAPNGKPKWPQILQRWNRVAEQKSDIFYKVSCWYYL
jgi:hypothetical protein